jgi:hypothetical protein
VVRHPQTALPSTNDARKRAIPYARGCVRVLRKHKYPISTCLLSVIRPALRCGQCLLKNQWPQAVLAFWTCAGRLQEFLRIPRSR